PDDVFAEPVDDHAEADQVDDAERADGPLIELHAERLLREVRAEPAVADSDEEQAQCCADGDDGAAHASVGVVAAGHFSAEPEADDPDGLPGEEIEGSGFLERDAQVGEGDDSGVNQVAEAELREQPDGEAGDEDFLPAEAYGRREND